MDGFVHHPYAESSVAPVDRPHPLNRTIGLADYDKLVGLLGEAFDGTAQPGSNLPLLYGEVGVETAVPAEQRHLYESDEVAVVASEQAQAAAYRRVLELVACQRTVVGVLFFHLRDEPRLEGWQSGVRYASGTPKASHDAVAAAVELPARASWTYDVPREQAILRADRGAAVGAVRRYTFYRVDPAWRRLPVEERVAGKEAFADVVEEWAGRMEGLRAYATTGVRPDADFFLWKITERTTTCSSWVRRSTPPRSQAGWRRPTPSSRRRSRRSTPTRSACARGA